MKQLLFGFTLALVASAALAHADGGGEGTFIPDSVAAPGPVLLIPAHPAGCTGWTGTKINYWSYSTVFGWTCQSYDNNVPGGDGTAG